MATGDYPIPVWRVTLDGEDLTDKLRPRLLDLTLNECRSDEADQLDLRLHDHDGRLAIPKRDAVLRVSIGWAGEGLVDKGSFTVDEVEHSGAPDIISVRARSADLTKDMRVRAERSWHDTTLGAVLQSIAGRHSLQARIDGTLSAIAIPHLDQTGESDANLLTRLGKRYDAVATIKAGALIFSPIGKGVTTSGQPLPSPTISRAQGDQHRYTLIDRDKYSGARAYWHDKDGANRKSELAGESGNAKRLPHTFHNQQEAREAATAEWKRLQRGAAKLSYTLALGRPDISPEQHVQVSGFKPEIDAIDWLVVKVGHTITGSAGFTTQLEMETAISAGESEGAQN